MDQARTRAELQALFADNTTGDITEQSARDLIASVPLTSEKFTYIEPGQTDLNGHLLYYLDDGQLRVSDSQASDFMIKATPAGGIIGDGDIALVDANGEVQNAAGGTVNVGGGTLTHVGALLDNSGNPFTGVSGYSGKSGYSGATGPTGSTGTSGFSGYSGTAGSAGSTGTSGFSGYSGRSGYSGISGFSGKSGYSGYEGDRGCCPTYTITATGGAVLGTFNLTYGIQGGDPTPNYWEDGSGSQLFLDRANGVWRLRADDGNGSTEYTVSSGLNPCPPSTGWVFDTGATPASTITLSNCFTGTSGYSGKSGYSGVSGFSGYSGKSGYSGVGTSGYSGISGFSGLSPTPIVGVVTAATSTNYTPDASVGNTWQIAASANVTINNPTNATNGQKIVLAIRNTSGGAISVTLGANFRFGSDITSIPNIAAGKTTYIGCMYTTAGSVTKWDIIATVAGY